MTITMRPSFSFHFEKETIYWEDREYKEVGLLKERKRRRKEKKSWHFLFFDFKAVFTFGAGIRVKSFWWCSCSQETTSTTGYFTRWLTSSVAQAPPAALPQKEVAEKPTYIPVTLKPRTKSRKSIWATCWARKYRWTRLSGYPLLQGGGHGQKSENPSKMLPK